VKLKAVQKAPVKEEETKEQRSRRGRNSRNKGASFERTIAGKFKKAYGEELVRTPQSGGFVKNDAKAGDFRGDVVPADDGVSLKLHVECKNAQTWSLPKWFKQAESDCPKGKIPTVVFHQYGTSKDYIALSLEDFFSIVPKDMVISKKVKK
jgi:hypothetical protein